MFAPTDEAFANLPAGTVEDLLKPENKEKLRSRLLYQVTSAKTAEGQPVTIKVEGGKVMVKQCDSSEGGCGSHQRGDSGH